MVIGPMTTASYKPPLIVLLSVAINT